MSGEDFRRVGHRMVDWIADYWSRAESFPVLSQVRPGEILSKLPAAPPDRADPAAWDAIFRDLDSIILPGITHWQSPSFFAYFPANSSGPGVLAELLSAGLGVQGMLWVTSPACTELETRMLDWLAGMLGLPERFLSTSANGGGVIEGTASEATLVAMIAARERALGKSAAGTPPLSSRTRTSPPRGAGESASADGDTDIARLVVYTSTQAHSSVIKAAMIAGIARGPDDRERVRLIDVDDRFAMRADLLEEAMKNDYAAGRVPFFVCATVGTTGTTAIDPLQEIAGVIARCGGELSERAGARGPAWLHVDAAHAGAACVCPEFRPMLAGVERADSFAFNPHKWLLTNFDCNCFWTADRAAVINALSITPEYLRNAASDTGKVIDYRDWQVPLGRRFRALKLWFVIRHYGVEGLRSYIREHVRLAGLFEDLVRSDVRFEVATPRTMNLVCFRWKGEGEESDRFNKDLMNRLNQGGRMYLTHTVLPRSAESRAGVKHPLAGRLVLRLAIGSVATQERHVREAWAMIRDEASKMSA